MATIVACVAFCGMAWALEAQTDLVLRLIDKASMSSAEKEVARKLVTSVSETDGWAGVLPGGSHFGAAAVRIPPSGQEGGAALAPSFVRLAEKEARFRLVAGCAMRGVSGELPELRDAELRSRAVILAVREDGLEAQVRIRTSGATYSRGTAAAYAVGGPDGDHRGSWIPPSFRQSVRRQYSSLLAGRGRSSMKRSAWQEALGLFREAAAISELRPEAMLDTAECFLETGSPKDALALLADAAERAGAAADAAWWERCGDLALRVGSTGEELAIRAFAESASVLNR